MNNEKAIAALVQLLDKSQNEYTHKLAAKSLGKIVTSNKDISLVVQALRRYKLDSEDYDLIWNCAQNMPYPEFYQAWHHS
jgi:HEAT repeat protein